MSLPPIIAYHAVWSAYGFWLPNDQRGSWSTEVWAHHLRQFGDATKTSARRSVAHRPFDRALRKQAQSALKYPAVRFTRDQIDMIAKGFDSAVARFQLKLHACAIVWDHVHIVSERHRERIEFVARVLKSAATRAMTATQHHPLREFADDKGRAPTPWADGGWERYLHTPEEITDVIHYVNGNPPKRGLPVQNWSFITPYPA